MLEVGETFLNFKLSLKFGAKNRFDWIKKNSEN